MKWELNLTIYHARIAIHAWFGTQDFELHGSGCGIDMSCALQWNISCPISFAGPEGESAEHAEGGAAWLQTPQCFIDYGADGLEFNIGKSFCSSLWFAALWSWDLLFSQQSSNSLVWRLSIFVWQVLFQRNDASTTPGACAKHLGKVTCGLAPNRKWWNPSKIHLI